MKAPCKPNKKPILLPKMGFLHLSSAVRPVAISLLSRNFVSLSHSKIALAGQMIIFVKLLDE